MTKIFITLGYNNNDSNKKIYGIYPTLELAENRMKTIPDSQKLDNIAVYEYPFSEITGTDINIYN